MKSLKMYLTLRTNRFIALNFGPRFDHSSVLSIIEENFTL